MARGFSLRVLPSPSTRRWTARRKAAVVMAVDRGEITEEEACRRYRMSEEEFLSWKRRWAAGGLDGLRAAGGLRHLSASARPRSSAVPGLPPPEATLEA